MPRSHAFVLHQPGRPFLGGNWMRGVTVERLGVLAAVLVFINANNPSFSDDAFLSRTGRVLFLSAQHFIAALPMFVLVVQTEIWTANSTPRRRLAALMLAVVVGSALFAVTRWAIRFGAAANR